MAFELKKMETDAEIRGKAYVHWKGWHEAYPGLISEDYLEKFTLEKCEKSAFTWRDNVIVAKEGDRVIGFVSWGCDSEHPENGEIVGLYVLSEFYGKGVGRRLMEAGLVQLEAYPRVCLWVLEGNGRAIRFYEKCGFRADGAKMENARIAAAEIRMALDREKMGNGGTSDAMFGAAQANQPAL